MKPSAFEYHPVTSLEEAVDLLGRFGSDAKVIAGGKSLVPLLALRLARVDHLIDINRVDGLGGITANDSVTIGALTRHRSAERSPVILDEAPLLAGALAHVGHLAIRTRGTIGGSLAHADPAAEIPAVLVALEGTVTAQSEKGSRIVQEVAGRAGRTSAWSKSTWRPGR